MFLGILGKEDGLAFEDEKLREGTLYYSLPNLF